MFRSKSHQTNFFWLFVFYIILRCWIYLSIDWQSSDTNWVKNLTRFRHVSKKIFILNYWQSVIFFCLFNITQNLFHKSLLPILVHERLILINHCVQRCFINFHQEICNHSWMNFIVSQYSLRKISIFCRISIFCTIKFDW